MREPTRDFEHMETNTPATAIGGEYHLTGERRMALGDAVILYYTGIFMVDRSCCGAHGGAYALVVGFVVDRAYKITPAGRPVSRVRPVESRRDRARIESIIREQDPLIRVVFL